jgi:hypothetical protein
MHCIDGPAIKFRDGYCLYYLWGVSFSADVFEKYVVQRVLAKDVFAVQNQEQKAALIKLYGYEKLLEDLPDVRVVDKLEKRVRRGSWLARVLGFDSSRVLLHVLYTFDLSVDVHPYFVMVEDFSTDRKYFIGVPQCKSALEALAWTFQTTPEKYAELVLQS